MESRKKKPRTLLFRRDAVVLLLALLCFAHTFSALNQRALSACNGGFTLSVPISEAVVPSQGDSRFIWSRPQPAEARFLGWEDDYMRKFKTKHYKGPTQKLADCVDQPENPYNHYYLCEINAYIPARMPMDPNSQMIPRVIFVSWITRQITVQQFTSIMAVLAHNPDYELIFMIDDEVDEYVCSNYPHLAPSFSRLKSGASRTDVWRMMVMLQYGGLYFDFDNTSIGHIPIQGNSSLVSGMRCSYTHLPSKAGAVLEHWAFAFQPQHPLIQRTLDIIMKNIDNPERIETEAAIEAEKSYTSRLSGPVPYQQALHDLLEEAECRKDESNSYCPALKYPAAFCNSAKFLSLFGNIDLDDGNMETTYHYKIVKDDDYGLPNRVFYDHPSMRLLAEPRGDLCARENFAKTRADFDEIWRRGIKEKKQKWGWTVENSHLESITPVSILGGN